MTLHEPSAAGMIKPMASRAVEIWDPFQTAGSDQPGQRLPPAHVAFVEQSRNLTTEVCGSVRRSIQDTLPRPVAALLVAAVTWLIGCPHRGQKPLVRRSKLVYPVEAFGSFLITIGLGHLALAYDQPARLRLVLPQQSRFLLDPALERSLPTARRVKGPAILVLTAAFPETMSSRIQTARRRRAVGAADCGQPDMSADPTTQA
jgi:hypothetical protein